MEKRPRSLSPADALAQSDTNLPIARELQLRTHDLDPTLGPQPVSVVSDDICNTVTPLNASSAVRPSDNGLSSKDGDTGWTVVTKKSRRGRKTLFSPSSEHLEGQCSSARSEDNMSLASEASLDPNRDPLERPPSVVPEMTRSDIMETMSVLSGRTSTLDGETPQDSQGVMPPSQADSLYSDTDMALAPTLPLPDSPPTKPTKSLSPRVRTVEENLANLFGESSPIPSTAMPLHQAPMQPKSLLLDYPLPPGCNIDSLRNSRHAAPFVDSALLTGEPIETIVSGRVSPLTSLSND